MDGNMLTISNFKSSSMPGKIRWSGTLEILTLSSLIVSLQLPCFALPSTRVQHHRR